MPTNVQIKWNKQVFDDVNIEGLQTGLEFKKKVQELTGVPVDRQKVMGLGAGILKDDANLTNLKVKNGQVIRLMGSAEEIPEAPKDKPVFVEDLLSKGSSDETAIQFYPSGLENLQNTCYMNASLEMLRYVPELKNAVVNFDGTNVSELYEKDKTLTRELKTLYSQLENTNDSIAPMQFLNALRTAYPQFAEKEQTELGPVYSQQDADEFLGNLLSSLENMLKVKDENVIQKLFEGEFDVKLQCTECEEEAIHSKEKFKKLSCFISQQINNLPYGLQKSLETTLEKESPTLGKTALYSKIQRISKLPNYLLVNFVRFYWKQKEQVKAKILREVQFPFSLDVFDLCSEEYQKELKETREKWRQLREEEMKKKKEETLTGQVTKKLKTVNESSSSQQQQEEELIPIDQVEDSGWFELCGVVTHKGRTSNSGHYVGWVKDDKGRWLEFDDDDVTQVSEEDIKKLSGGGDWHCAYMLLYRKCRTAP